jgi:polar amino acid transport system permease protein
MNIADPTTSEIVIGLIKLLAVKGLPVTLFLSVAGFSLALLVGCVCGIVRFLKWPFFSQVIALYVDFMRGLPFLMVVFFLFYVFPFLGIRLSAIQAGILALTLHTGAYLTEIVRSSLNSIPQRQHEAAKALALSGTQRMRFVIIPQAVRIALPPAAGQAVLHIKDTSVVSIIALTELTRVARVQMQSNMQPLLTFALLALFYMAVCYPVLRVSLQLEKRLSKSSVR